MANVQQMKKDIKERRLVNNTVVKDVYARKQKETLELLELLKEKICKENLSPNWADIGTMGYFCDQLSNLVNPK